MNPRVFVSYSHDTEDFKQWVRVFADRLQSEGVEVTLDQYDLHLGDATPHFMEKGVAENDYVLLLVTKGYIEKAALRKGGVGFETDLVTGEIVVSRNRKKFIPILIKVTFEELPPFLKGASAVVIRDMFQYEKEYEQLYRTLTGQELKKPTLGKIRVLEAAAHADSPFNTDVMSKMKNTTNYCYWDVWISSLSLADMTLPELFPLYQRHTIKKTIQGIERLYPFILDPSNKKTHHPELVYESGDYSGVSNVASFDKIVFLSNHIRYSYIDLTDDQAAGISPRWVEGGLIAFLRMIEKIHSELGIQPNVEITVKIRASKPVVYLESRSMFEFKKGVMDFYFLMQKDMQVNFAMKTFLVADYEALWRKIHGSFVSDQPKSMNPYLSVSGPEFRRTFGRLLNSPDFY